jgi:hypothetical protein
MPLYYQGDLDKDLASLEGLDYVDAIKSLCQQFAYGAIQQIVLDRQGYDEFAKRNLPAILAFADSVGVKEFCRVVQILWAEQAKLNNYPMIGALDCSCDGPGQAERELAEIRKKRGQGSVHTSNTLH